MVHIKIKKGLDIPIKGKPEGHPQQIILSGEASSLKHPNILALNLSGFDEVKFRLLCAPGDAVKVGQPLAEDKSFPGRFFVSPAGGLIKDIVRGPKRALHYIVISVGAHEEYVQFDPLDSEKASREQIIDRMKLAGIFACMRSRPFNLLANPLGNPKSIFVKAIESAPFKPPAEFQVLGYEKEFQQGLNLLGKLTQGKVHLVHHKDTPCQAFNMAQNVQRHTAEGPHPIGNVSVHIQYIDRINSPADEIWVLTARDVVRLGYLFMHQRILTDRVISIAGPGVLPQHTGYFKLRDGYPIEALLSGRIEKGLQRFISGDPLMGHKVDAEGFMGFYDDVFCVIPENTQREFLHFLSLGADKYTHSWAYMSGHNSPTSRSYDFTTSMHGEHRPFIDGSVYDSVMPLDVPVMLLTKAVLAENFELAEQYGLLEVDSEDFALPTFVCPSKIEIAEIMHKGLKEYAKEFTR